MLQLKNVVTIAFSLSWSRILPTLTAIIVPLRILQRLIDFCMEVNITPWLLCTIGPTLPLEKTGVGITELVDGLGIHSLCIKKVWATGEKLDGDE